MLSGIEYAFKLDGNLVDVQICILLFIFYRMISEVPQIYKRVSGPLYCIFSRHTSLADDSFSLAYKYTYPTNKLRSLGVCAINIIYF